MACVLPTLGHVSSPSLSLKVDNKSQLSFVMQQCAVPWLRRIVLQNDGDDVLADVCIRIEVPGFVDPGEIRFDQLQVGERRELAVPDLPLETEAFANQIERTRADLVVTVEAGGVDVLRDLRAIDVLAYNEWPGLQDMPGLLAAFVSPNHPDLSPVLHAVAERLEQVTGDGALNGYQAGDPQRVRAMLAAVHDAVCAASVRYVSAPPSFERSGQKIRMPEQVLGERLGTCLDLSLLYAAVLEQIGLQPVLIVQNGHALVGVWLTDERHDEQELGPSLELRKAVKAGVLQVIESTMACVVPAQTPARAMAAGEQRLLDDKQFRVALDVAAARRAGIRPLPVRTSTYQAVVGELPDVEHAGEHDGAPVDVPNRPERSL